MNKVQARQLNLWFPFGVLCLVCGVVFGSMNLIGLWPHATMQANPLWFDVVKITFGGLLGFFCLAVNQLELGRTRPRRRALAQAILIIAACSIFVLVWTVGGMGLTIATILVGTVLYGTVVFVQLFRAMKRGGIAGK